MKFEQLIPVGILSKNLDKAGYFNCKLMLDLPPGYEELKEVFLIFKDNRVRFVDVEFSKSKIMILEDDIKDDVLASGGARIALLTEDIDELRVEEGMVPLANMNIVYNKEIIGKLIDSFDNNAHEVLVVKLNNGKEIMIPFVEHFVSGTDKNQIFVKNIKDLLEL